MDFARRRIVLGAGAGVLAAASPKLLSPALDRGASHGASADLHAAAAPAPGPVAATDVRTLFVESLHTGERLQAAYYENGGYVPEVLRTADEVLRDWRTGETHPIDPGLFDILDGLRTRLEASRPFKIISGYRSPRTNDMLSAKNSGVAKRSLHMDGKALDIRIQGVDLHHLHKAALDLGAGGVGFYPVSDFVHVDVGRVRRWTGA
ncbi:MAG: DUF882 domain-containing protein [Phenylobacterium sp.]|uniref:DUF882 domain-containing protein n=1 Tax=Phenylobacterium sp. TaxID=1871053 RepID=UPI00391DC7A8